ncbi:MAG: aspartate 1-decarboxylase [Actinomycetota bacterium]
MRRTMLHAKIHRATVTDANVDYEGSITIPRDLMDAAGILAFEQVQVVDVDNGARFETYVIEGISGSGELVVNGAAAHLVEPGHKVIIHAYAAMKESRARSFRPRIVLVDDANRPITPDPAYDEPMEAAAPSPAPG